MERLSADAKESVSKLIEKHSQEMLVMIAQRLSEVNVSIKSLIDYIFSTHLINAQHRTIWKNMSIRLLFPAMLQRLKTLDALTNDSTSVDQITNKTYQLDQTEPFKQKA